MAKKPEEKKTSLDKATISKILRTVSQSEGLHFFKGTGDPTGKIATSLVDFVEKMRVVDIRAVNYHFKRREFEKWMRETIGDFDLSKRIGKLGKETHGEKLRNEIVRIVKGRIDELKDTQIK